METTIMDYVGTTMPLLCLNPRMGYVGTIRVHSFIPSQPKVSSSLPFRGRGWGGRGRDQTKAAFLFTVDTFRV